MRKKGFLFFVLVLAVTVMSCGGSVQTTDREQMRTVDCSQADLTIVSGSNARLFLEDQADGTKGLLSRFAEQTGLKVCVQYKGGPEAVGLKAEMLLKAPTEIKTGEPSAFLFDSNIFADGLYDQAYVGNTTVGIWVRQSTVTRLGMVPGTPLTMEQYAVMMENGQLKTVTAPAYLSTPASIMFLQMLSAYYGPNNQLTPEQVLDQEAQDFGKRVYDHFVKSATSTSDAINLALKNDGQMYDSVVAFESSLMGKVGKNADQTDPFIFFYFNPSVISTITFGRVQLEGITLENYNLFSSFLTSEASQIYIASTGIRPQKDVVDLDPALFKKEWGLVVFPAVTLVSPPPYSIVSRTLDIYRDFYKRVKIVKVLLDVSPSMYQNAMTVDMGGVPTSVFRIQALDLALLKITKSSWLVENKIPPGKNDIFEYYFFSTQRSDMVTQTIGLDTDAAGTRLDYFLKPATGDWYVGDFEQKMAIDLNGFVSNGTAMFNASRDMLEQIETNYDPNVDYYIVILTDGQDGGNFSGRDFFNMWNNFAGGELGPLYVYH